MLFGSTNQALNITLHLSSLALELHLQRILYLNPTKIDGVVYFLLAAASESLVVLIQLPQTMRSIQQPTWFFPQKDIDDIQTIFDHLPTFILTVKIVISKFFIY